MFKKRHISRLALVGVLSLGLAACSGNTTPPADGNGATPTEAETPAPESETEKAPLFDELPDWAKEKGKLVFAGDSHPPYRVVEPNGSFSGMDPDLQELLEGQLGVDIELEVTSGMDAILTGMLSGRYDAFNGPVRATPEREADFDAIAYMTTRSAYVFLAENADTYGGPHADAVCGTLVAGVQGSITETEVEKLNVWCADQGKEQAEFLGLADTNATVLAVQSGRADSLALTEPGALDLMRQNPDTFGYVTQSDDQGSFESLLAMLAPKDNDLGPILHKAMQNLFDDGSYLEYMEQWEVANVAIDAPLLNPTTSK